MIMAKILALFAFSVVQCGYAADSLVAWRFTNLQTLRSQTTVRDVLKLEAIVTNDSIPDGNYRWYASTCLLSMAVGKVTYLKCDHEGIHQVKLHVDNVGEKSKEIGFSSTYNCYEWYMHIEATLMQHDNESFANEKHYKNTRHEKLKVWVFDYIRASKSELNNTAVIPSQTSKLLTTEFYILGQTPTITKISWLTSGTVERKAALQKFDKTAGYWLFELVAFKDEFNMKAPHYVATSLPIALFNCFIKERVMVSYYIKYGKLTKSPPQYYIIAGDNQALTLLPDPCHDNVATVIVRNRLYLTQDDFNSITLLPAPLGLTNHLTVSAIAMMYNYIIVLSLDKKLYYLGTQESQFKQFDVGEDVRPTIISSQDWCIEGWYTQDKLDLLTMSDDHRIWVSNNLNSVEELSLPVERLHRLSPAVAFSFQVQDISLDIHPGKIGVALVLTIGAERKVVFASHDWLLNEWTLAPFWVNFGSMEVGRISFYFLGLAKSSFFFRNQRNLFYSYDESQSYGLKTVHGCDGETDLAGDDNHIRDVIVSRKGDVSILLSSNQILFGKVKQQELVLFDMFDTPGDQNTIHWFDDLNQLWIIKVNEDNSVKKIKYPLKDELQAAIGVDKFCPYRYFIHNIQEQVYLLDKQEIWSFWAILVYRQEKQNTLDVLFTDSHEVIDFTTETKKIYSAGVTSENKTITFTHKPGAHIHGKDKFNSKSNVAVMELRPRRSNLLCKASNSAVAYMSVGCSRGRRLSVQVPQKCDANVTTLYPNGHIIPGGLWANLTTGEIFSTDKQITLTDTDLSCPIIVRNEQTFKPVLELYDYNNFIKTVTADFIIWETHGRIDYAFTHNLEEVLCLSEAQSWKTMRKNANYSVAADDLWGPHNYRSCYIPDEHSTYFSEHVHDIKYEVLNESSSNSITFNHDYDSLHIFKVRVVDPSYSFCNLTATFAVHVEGIKIPSDLQDIAVANYSVLTGILLSLIATYIWFHRQTLRKQMMEQKYENLQ